MAQFTIRVVLQVRPTIHHFRALTKWLQACGITDQMRSDEGDWYTLPQGEYYTMDPLIKIEDVRDTVAGLADAIKPGCEVMVTEGERRAWSGLAQVSTA